MFENAKWIWYGDKSEKGQHVNFFFGVTVEDDKDNVIFNIACETKYYLHINNKLVVFDGGLFRESVKGCGYYDSIDITRYIHSGYNDFAIEVIYYGNGGRNNSFCKSAGLIFECKELNLFSDERVLAESDKAYVSPSSKEPTFLYGGNHTAFDAQVHPFFEHPIKTDDASFATVLGSIGDEPWGEMLPRPIPLIDFDDITVASFTADDNVYKVRLPYAMHFSPYFRINAKIGTQVTVYSDRYRVNGGPGDDHNTYYGHRAEYYCCDGEQEFELRDWLFGEEIIFNVQGDAEIIRLGYRESQYPASVTTTFKSDDPFVNKVFEKAVRTLKVCMRENFMDCPDRERGQWIGDVSVQAPQVVYLLDGNGMLLLKKAIYDFINLRKGDVLVGNVPGDNFCELPSQSLNAISKYGMIATYYEATEDISVLKLAFEPAIRYLMLWDTDDDGVVLRRVGGWEWYDHLYNVDNELLNVCWYYSALEFAQRMADVLENHNYDEFISNRMKAIEECFVKRYWNEKWKCFASGDFVDDRANAMAVLSGLCDKERYPYIKLILESVFNSTTYMENYVLCALCEMGYKESAFKRMMCRYQPLINSPNSTLWEDFFRLGTRNHAWSGAPVTVLLRYFAGINNDLSVNETDIYPLKKLDCSFVNKNGKRIRIRKRIK